MERIDKARIRSERAFKYAMLAPAVLWVIGFTFFPIFSAINYSLANYVLGRGITGYVGLQNFVNVLSDGGFWYSLLITLIYVVVSVPIEVAVGFLLAWIITVGLPGRGIFRAIFTAPLFTMEVAIGYLGVTMFTSQGGMVPTLLSWIGLEIPWMATADRGFGRGDSAGYLAMDAVCLLDVVGRAGRDSQRHLRCRHVGSFESLAGLVARRTAACLAGDDGGDPVENDRRAENVRVAFRFDERWTREQAPSSSALRPI